MVRWETVNSGVRLKVESCVELKGVTLNLYVHFYYYFFFPMFYWSTA